MATWERYVTEHEDFESQYGDCVSWLEDLQQRLQACSTVTGDRFSIENRLAKLVELQLLTDEGSNRVKQVVDCAQPVLPATSTRGKDIIQVLLLIPYLFA